MMSSLLGFDVLPALNEGDERICLADILMLRDRGLDNDELWSVCKECCLGIQDVNSSEMFQTLCITPESLAFDSSGAVCFLDLATDPETMYIPPEYENVGNSYKAHLFSLGMTLLFAAEYNAGESETVGMEEELSALVARMTAEDYDERASLAEVMRLCEANLKGKCSQRLCMQMASIAKLDSSADTDDSMSYHDSPMEECRADAPSSSHPESKETLTEECPHHRNANSKDIGDDDDRLEFGAITPPVSFRNSIEEYKKALVKSQGTSVVLPSPPKVSRMKALVDNGEIKMVEIPSSGSESAGEDSVKTPSLLTSPVVVTPTLSQVNSPVPAMDLGVSQDSAFQVVWSPRSSKHTSPVPGQSQEQSGSANKSETPGTTTSLQALADAKNVNYANLLSAAAMEDRLTPNQIIALTANNISGANIIQTLDLIEGDGVDSDNNENNKTKNARTESELRKKLDKLMAKYTQRKPPKMEPPAANPSIWNAEGEDLLQDIPELLPRYDPSGNMVMTHDQAPISSIPPQMVKSGKSQHVDPDFEFGPTISPVPTFVRRQSVETSDSSEPETDSLEGDADTFPTKSNLRISVVKLNDDSDGDGEEEEDPENGNQYPLHRLRVNEHSESGILDEVTEEEEEEQEEAEKTLTLQEEEGEGDSCGDDQGQDSDTASCVSTEGEVDKIESENSVVSTTDSEISDQQSVTSEESSEEEEEREEVEDSEESDIGEVTLISVVGHSIEGNMEVGERDVLDHHAPVNKLITGDSTAQPDTSGDGSHVGEDQRGTQAHLPTNPTVGKVSVSTASIAHTKQGSSGLPYNTQHSYHPQEGLSTSSPDPSAIADPLGELGENVNSGEGSTCRGLSPSELDIDGQQLNSTDYQKEGLRRQNVGGSEEEVSSHNDSVDSGSSSLSGMNKGEKCLSDSEGSSTEEKGGRSEEEGESEGSSTEAVSDTDSCHSPRTQGDNSHIEEGEEGQENKSQTSSCWSDTDSASDSDTETPRAVTDTSRDEDDDEEEEVTKAEDKKEELQVKNTEDDQTQRSSDELVGEGTISETAPNNGTETERKAVTDTKSEGQEGEKEEGEEKVEKTDKEEEKQGSSMMSGRANVSASRGPIGSGLKIPNYGEPDRQSQTVQEILEKLGYGLHENELWALCRECVAGLNRYRYDLPAYISPETVFIEDGGEVGYQSVPDDRELEVVYLAPELQEHGVVTEKTCLYGIAAMLWSAADYKLPANHEPAITDELENLFISMTQDNQDLRPKASDVLMVCTEYDRRNEVSSRAVCQSLYSDAQKAEAFGRDNNALVRDILVDDIKKSQASRQAQIVNCIKVSPELQAQLKPVSERQLAAKPVVRTLHDKLMDEIINPTKKLRKSSKPKVMSVKEIFLNNPDLMLELRHVIGGRTMMMNSAFSTTAGHPSHLTPASMQPHLQPSTNYQLPNAYQSAATHFSPIVVNANGQQQMNKPQVKANESNMYSSVNDQKMARKMKELKKNLLKSRAPLTIAKDVEEDAHHDQGISQVPNHISPLQNQSHQLSPGFINSQQTMVNGQMGMSGQAMGGTSPSGIFPFQVQLQPDPRTGFFQLIPVPVQQQQQQQQTTSQQSPQNLVPQQQMPQTMSQQGYGVQQQQPSVPAQAQNSGTQQKSLSPAEELANQLQKESEERRRYLKYTQELRARVKSENIEYQEAQRTKASSSRSGERKSEARTKTRSSKDKEDRRRSHTIASSDVKDDLARATNNVRKRVNDSRRSHSSSTHRSGSNLKKASSEENILEKVEKSNGYSSRSHHSEDARTRLKRAKSGSSLDYKNMEVRVKDIQIEDNSNSSHYSTRHQRSTSRDSSAHLSKSQPHLDLDLPQDDVRRPRDGHRRSRPAHGGEDNHVRSPLGEGAASPPPSPSLSKDSGVSGLNMKASGEMTLMERLLNADTLRHQQRLSKVICLLRDEFAFDGYMENGVEDFAMAEYVLSLGNLTWETFNNAITEKYCDLFWQDELLSGLYEAVNGSKPVIEKRISSQQKPSHPEESKSSYPQSSSQNQRNQHSRARPPSPKPPILPQSPKKMAGSNNPHAHWNGNHMRATQDTITGSAFRPIRAIHPVENSSSGNSEGPVLKPKAMKAASSHTDTSDSTDNEVSHRPRRFRKKPQLEKGKSSSLHDLYVEKNMVEVEDNNNLITKAHSQSNLMDNEQEPSDHVDPHRLATSQVHPGGPQRQKMGIAVSLDGNKPKVVYIRSSESENDSYESNTNTGYHHDDGGQRNRHLRAMANSTAGYRTSNSFAYRYDSDSSSTSDRKNETSQFNNNPFQRQNVQRTAQRNLSRDDSQSESSRGSGQSVTGRRIMAAKSESYLNILTSGDEFGSRDRLYSGTKRTFRGSVVYYPAEMEHYLRPEIREFAMQVDTRTKENIEAKMATLDQEMMVEHRQKKKTFRFYQKLSEANRAGKGGDQKGMMAKVSKQLMEMNTKLEFLDSAKKHLEMLYAEQWGLDHYLLYSLAQCQPDEPMLLSPSENPMLQYQVMKGGANGDDGHVLQAGLHEGLMAYLFAQNALSEGFIHQFFYCFRYFTTPAELLDFLMVKFHAATLSLSPEADVPAKVKSRAIDLLQVWIEGYFSIDFKHNTELTDLLYDFIKEKVLPLEPSSEYLLEVLEDAQDERHTDLYYPQFCVADDLENQLIHAEAPAKKWESFKAALHLSAKPQKFRQPVKTRVASMSSDRHFGQFEIDKYDHEAYFPKGGMMGRRTDIFVLSEYPSQTLAEQLSMMEQDLFRQSHPVHYLNSKAQGVGVALTAPAINKAQSMYRLTAAWEDNQESSLFVGTFTTDDIIQRMLEHSQAISFWVAAEIVVCDSAKEQVSSICKFLTTAKICQEMRNYATCISILDGLENVLVRQVPAWRNITSKYAAIMEELSSVRVFLKSDNMCLLESGEGRRHPTIPCILLFLLHVQQMEIGGFRLANTMYKWTKMKAISKVIDQIRIFKERNYNYEPDLELQDMIRQRMRDLGQQDLHVIAAQHDNNFQKMSSKVPGIFKRMKGKKSKAVDV